MNPAMNDMTMPNAIHKSTFDKLLKSVDEEKNDNDDDDDRDDDDDDDDNDDNEEEEDENEEEDKEKDNDEDDDDNDGNDDDSDDDDDDDENEDTDDDEEEDENEDEDTTDDAEDDDNDDNDDISNDDINNDNDDNSNIKNMITLKVSKNDEDISFKDDKESIDSCKNNNNTIKSNNKRKYEQIDGDDTEFTTDKKRQKYSGIDNKKRQKYPATVLEKQEINKRYHPLYNGDCTDQSITVDDILNYLKESFKRHTLINFIPKGSIEDIKDCIRNIFKKHFKKILVPLCLDKYVNEYVRMCRNPKNIKGEEAFRAEMDRFVASYKKDTIREIKKRCDNLTFAQKTLMRMTYPNKDDGINVLFKLINGYIINTKCQRHMKKIFRYNVEGGD